MFASLSGPYYNVGFRNRKIEECAKVLQENKNEILAAVRRMFCFYVQTFIAFRVRRESINIRVRNQTSQ